jgi:hypothetical protein
MVLLEPLRKVSNRIHGGMQQQAQSDACIMLPALLRLFFGCKHEFGFPVTDPESHRTYQV